jgi:RNA polymerase sigma-54 factor
MNQPALRQLLEQRQSLRQEQIMAPHQIQSLEILMAAIPELEQKISEELVENPTLEMLENGTEQLVGNPLENSLDHHASDTANDEFASEKSETIENLLKLDELWHDRMPVPAAARRGYSAEDDERRQFFFDSLAAEKSMQEVLLEQLRETDGLDEFNERLCREIIGSIDDSGYLRTHLADIATACHTTDLKQVEHALRVVQQFEPAGIGARDLRECLLLQLERLPNARKRLEYRVVDKYLDDVGRNRLTQVSRALNVSLSELKEALARVRKLNPHPGSQVTPTERSDFVAPEVFVDKDEDGNWRVRTNRDYIPRLRISPYYIKLLKDKDTNEEVKSYIRSKIGNSKLLLRALEQRESTIVRITRSLLKFQLGFFDNGVEDMKPLTMSQVADDIEVHETTVSRAITNKYIQTPHGLFPFKHFFTTGYESSSGEQVSSRTVKQKIRDAINAENPQRPLSDQQLSKILKQEGFEVARRTVAKYREELGILSSSLRRKY